MNIVEPIFAQCRNKPSELALCAPGTELNLMSYGRLERSVNSIGRRIIAAGIPPKSRIAVVIEDPLLHAMVSIALTRLGIVSVSANNGNASWPFALDGAIADRRDESLPASSIIAGAEWTAGDGRPIPDKHIFRAAPDDLCRIFLVPAGADRQAAIAMTNRMIAARLDRQKIFLGRGAPFCDRTHLGLPLREPLGFQVMLGTLWRGGALVMASDVQKTLVALADYDIQNMIAAPPTLLRLAETIETNPGYQSNLTAAFASNSLPAHTSQRIRATLTSNLTQGHLANDGTMVASMPAQAAASVPWAVGYVLPGVTAQVIDDQDRCLPPGQDGKLRIRSENGVTEYFEDANETRRAFRNGWFYTGDRGRLTSDNMLAILPESDVSGVTRS